ncbi:hypothetical protein P8C59_008990 [Phyllachora maydis]|uniref:WW domain-containing protein n=1 Tax=Phyllachora maydis TaxID=1825666 RepID=A0AAD9IC96_9PEZI|nr:hypothetical protein P8C59_008990 [Phyllachora maydis]
MLKSTYQPSPGALQPLAPGWTEHKAPTGHTYYYNGATGESTYTRPVAQPSPAPALPTINLSDPGVANAFMAAHAPLPPRRVDSLQPQKQQQRPRPQPRDRPMAQTAIPGCAPWMLVTTKYGRRFAYNPEKKASYWRIPEKLTKGILELDTARIREKALGGRENPGEGTRAAGESANREGGDGPDFDSSEYEEVEVTDSEGEGEGEGEGNDANHPRKRPRTDDTDLWAADDSQDTTTGPLEFTEADMAAQLAALEADALALNDNDADPGLPLSDADARLLFADLLDDLRISPYASWDTLLEQGRLAADTDPRYTALPTTRARRAVFESWARTRIAAHQAARAREEKKDPRIGYLALLQARATPKLFWPEFKRKYRGEAAMRDRGLPDRDRERLYREHVKRLALPVAQARADLKALLGGVPRGKLHRGTAPEEVPAEVRADVRWITLDAKTRDEFVTGYIQGLPPAPEEGERTSEEDPAASRAREERARRERALRERERAVAEGRAQEEKRAEAARLRLRDEEREVQKAMQVGKKGLQSQLAVDEAAARTEG